MPSKPPPRAKGPAKPPRPAMPTIEVDIEWLEPSTDAGAAPKGKGAGASGHAPLPTRPPLEAPRRDTIPVDPAWLEVDEEPAPAPAPRGVPRPAAPAAKSAKKSSPPRRR